MNVLDQLYQVGTVRRQIDELKALVIQADAERASRVLLDLCAAYPVLAGILTLVRQGSIDQAVGNVGMFDADLANTLRAHRSTLLQISQELKKAEDQTL